MKENNTQVYKFINSIFQNITLCLGGIFLLNQVNDKLIWTIANSLEEIYEDSLNTLKILNFDSKIKQESPKELKPHPAIEKFLLRLEKEKQIYSKSK
jgi:hypothetical protein